MLIRDRPAGSPTRRKSSAADRLRGLQNARSGNRNGSLERRMVIASDLRQGMALRIDKQVFKVLEVDVKAGAAKMGGTVRALLSNVRSGRLWDQHFRPQERLDNVELEK